MKILIVTTISPTIGFLIPHINSLIENGNEVHLAFNITRTLPKEILNSGCKVYNVNFQRTPLKKENYYAYKKIRQIVKENKYDIIHTHTPIASFLTRLACRNVLNVKVLYTAHGFHFFKGAPTKNWIIFYSMERIAALYTDSIITMNEEDFCAAKKMKIRTPGNIYKVRGVGINLGKFAPPSLEEKKMLRNEYEYSDKDFILFYAAEMNENKNQTLLIETVFKLKEEIPHIKLLLAGNGILKNTYQKRVKDLNLENNIEFLGHRNDISNLLKITDVAVASSRREGLPVNIMEAMATGLPIVATDCRGQRDLIINGENGFIVKSYTAVEFANSLKKIYSSQELPSKFKINNLKMIKKYSVENVINEINKIYKSF